MRPALLGAVTAAALVLPLACAVPADERGSTALPSTSVAASSPTVAASPTTAAASRTTAAASPTTAAKPAKPASPAKQARSCATLSASLSRSEQVGQLLMAGISSRGLTSRQAGTLARGHVGSVILLGNSTAGRSAVKRLSGKVHAVRGKPRGVKIMLAVDQEGGQVQRLRGPGFDRMPSAKSQSRLSSAQLRVKAERWARQLRAAGVDANLAPVADLVPRSMERTNQPIGVLQRGYGPDPKVVAARVPAYVQGMHRGGVLTAVKHFPGLGRVRGNTDFTSRVVDRTTTRRDPALQGFAAGSARGVDMVMMSSAYYSKIDARHRAVFSKVVIGQLVRKDLAFDRVVISDDLAARAVRDYSPGKRAVTFLTAGGDLIIVGDTALVPAMVSAIKAKATADPRFRAELRRKVTRVLQMKASRGLASCG